MSVLALEGIPSLRLAIRVTQRPHPGAQSVVPGSETPQSGLEIEGPRG